jgi:hypothetical protein
MPGSLYSDMPCQKSGISLAMSSYSAFYESLVAMVIAYTEHLNLKGTQHIMEIITRNVQLTLQS